MRFSPLYLKVTIENVLQLSIHIAIGVVGGGDGDDSAAVFLASQYKTKDRKEAPDLFFIYLFFSFEVH